MWVSKGNGKPKPLILILSYDIVEKADWLFSYSSKFFIQRIALFIIKCHGIHFVNKIYNMPLIDNMYFVAIGICLSSTSQLFLINTT